jgi:hypothetical protein
MSVGFVVAPGTDYGRGEMGRRGDERPLSAENTFEVQYLGSEPCLKLKCIIGAEQWASLP